MNLGTVELIVLAAVVLCTHYGAWAFGSARGRRKGKALARRHVSDRLFLSPHNPDRESFVNWRRHAANLEYRLSLRADEHKELVAQVKDYGGDLAEKLGLYTDDELTEIRLDRLEDAVSNLTLDPEGAE